MSPSAPSGEVDSESVRTIREIHSVINGDNESRRLADALTYLDYQEPLRECVAGDGHEYRPPPFVSLFGSRVEVATPDTFHAFADIPTGDELIPSVQDDVRFAAEEARSKSGWVERGAPSMPYLDSVTRCAETVHSRSPAWPVADAELESRFWALMAVVAEQPEVLRASAEYPDCMKQHGFAVGDQVDLYIAVHNAYVDFAVDYVTPSSTKQPAGAEWEAAVAFEAKAATADRLCRRPVFDLATDKISPELPGFLADNALALDEARGFWSDLQDRARDRIATSDILADQGVLGR